MVAWQMAVRVLRLLASCLPIVSPTEREASVELEFDESGIDTETFKYVRRD